MRLQDLPVVDLRPMLQEERHDLLSFLRSLDADQWQAASAAGRWTVKDLALHILDDNLGWLSRGRDGDPTGLLRGFSDHSSFVTALAQKNQRWIDGARGLSGRVLIDLLQWAGEQMDGYYAAMDLQGDGAVVWASDESVPIWFDIAQDLTERWVHQRQMRDAVGRVDDYADKYLGVVLRTFVWAVPHQYRLPAPAGTRVALDLGGGGQWYLTNVGGDRWELDEGVAARADTRIVLSPEAAWRCFTAADFDPAQVTVEGNPILSKPFLDVRGIIV